MLQIVYLSVRLNVGRGDVVPHVVEDALVVLPPRPIVIALARHKRVAIRVSSVFRSCASSLPLVVEAQSFVSRFAPTANRQPHGDSETETLTGRQTVLEKHDETPPLHKTAEIKHTFAIPAGET